MTATLVCVLGLYMFRAVLHFFSLPMRRPKSFTSEVLVLIVVSFAAAAATTYSAKVGVLSVIVAISAILAQMFFLKVKWRAPSIQNIVKWFDYVYGSSKNEAKE